MATDSNLPFEMTTDALNDWLQSLSALPNTQAAHQLGQALKQLKEQKYPASELVPILINLTPLTLHFSTSLSSILSSDTQHSGKAFKLAKLSMQLPRQLALLFCQLVESKGLEAGVLQTCIYYALQLIGYSLRCYNLFYEMPSVSLWKKSTSLYKLAVENDCLAQSQSTKLAEFKAQLTIESVLKRNLLFTILAPTLFKADEISHFFQLANDSAHLLEISVDRDTHDFGFYWDLQSDIPPCPAKKNYRSLPDNFMALNTTRISHELQLGTIPTQLSPGTQNKLALILSGYRQVFGSIIPGLPSSSKLIAGFNSICAYLQEQNKLSKISQLSSQLPETSNHGFNLSLVPLEHQRNVFDADRRPFTKQQNQGKGVNLLKTPNKTYLIAESRGLECWTGDIVMLYKEQHPVSLAIIRQQNFSELSNANHFLLEQLPGSCNIYSIVNSSIDTNALLVGENSDNPQVFLAAGKYIIDSKIPLTIGKSLHLIACIESNNFFARFKFSFSS
ncbi:MAG: hypothetical protein PHR94_08565 [Methylomonas lenta]|nr:hypothetical protein [Methylomonas lenta]